MKNALHFTNFSIKAVSQTSLRYARGINMEQVNKLLEQTAYVLLYCLGVSFLLISCKNMGNSIEHLKHSLFRQNVLRQQELLEYKAKEHILTATRAEVIGYLTGSPEADIKIDGIGYSKESFGTDGFDYTILREGTYNKEYVLDEKNSITEIAFTHRE